MVKYKYAAKTIHGKIVSGIINADDEERFLADIKDRSLYLIKYKEIVTASKEISFGKNGPLPLKQIAIFCRQISALLKVGVSLIKAIDILYQQTTNKKMKESIKLIYESVQKGCLLSEALRKQTNKYPNIMIHLIESGEASGTMDQALSKLATQFESDLKLKNKITTAMVYPIILSILGIGVVILMVTFVIPRFMDMFVQAGIDKLPLPTRVILGLSSAITSYWYYILFAILLIIFSLKVYTKSLKGKLKWDEFKLHVPLFKSIIQKTAIVRFCRTTSTLFSSGMPMLQALSIVINIVGNTAISSQITEASEDIKKGMTLAQSMHRVTHFPSMIQSMILIGEESGSLDYMLENASNYFNDELENSIARMVTLIEPMLIVIMGIAVAFIISAIMLPMASIYNSI